MTGNPEILTNGVGAHLATEFQELERPEGELYLRFYVAANQEFALPAMAVREVISCAPDRITPIPNTPFLVLGTLNSRGRVIWVVDLGQFLGESTPLNTERSEIPVIVVEDQEILLALAVEQIIGMEWLNVEQVQALTDVPDNIAPFLRGEWVLGGQIHQYLRLMDQKAILRSTRWAA